MTYKAPLFFASLIVLAACQAQTEATAKTPAPAAQVEIEAVEIPQPASVNNAVNNNETAPAALDAKAAETKMDSPKAMAAAKIIAPAAQKVAEASTPRAVVPAAVPAVAPAPKPAAPAKITPASATATAQMPVVSAAATLPAVTAPAVPNIAPPSPTQPVQLAQAAEDAPEETAEKMSEPDNPNADYNEFLSAYVVPTNGINLVRYADVNANDKAKLDGYIDGLSKSGPPSGSKNEIMAYWFNLYNAKTVSLILDNYPIDSIRDIRGPWKKKILTVAGKPMSLDNIEHDTVRATYDEPRIHYAFNCASIGCPNLKTSAWEAATLDADLTQAAKDFVGSPRGVSIDAKGRVDASNIYKWYKEDFGGSEKGILAHIEPYATGEKKAAIASASKIDDFDYDWSLNIAK